MQVNQALTYLGSTRTIWIDDLFDNNPTKLANRMAENFEIARECNFEELNSIFKNAQFGPDPTELTELLLTLGQDRQDEIRQIFFAHESWKDTSASGELIGETLEKTCIALGVKDEDRWSFDEATSALPKLCEANDSHVSYVVDLKDSGTSEIRGLEILKLLRDKNSKGTAFILTHEAPEDGEVETEIRLRSTLEQDEGDSLSVPICVISKGRLENAVDDESLEDALKISIKRAGLRRSVSEVVSRVSSTVNTAFQSAAAGLLSVPPEQLEAHVFERGFKEGVSELHVVERVLTSHISQKLRMFFGTDDEVLKSTKRLRSLREIKLNQSDAAPDPNLAQFRLAEIWESDELINRELAPIACGDVFEPDPYEKRVKDIAKKFILLAQPCDIALRPNGERNQDTGFFVPLVRSNDGLNGERDTKKPLLPCKLGEEYWACDFRSATAVKMAILDLASFRDDGRVRVDEKYAPPDNLLMGQSNIYKKRTEAATKAIQTGKPIDPANGTADASLQLTFNSRRAFSHFHCGVFEGGSRPDEKAEIPALPKRITWRLRRSGRVRMPYSAALLNQYLGIMSRQAFDMDYMSPGFKDGNS